MGKVKLLLQKKEIREIFNGVTGAGEFDYVTGWYKKAVEFTLGTSIYCAFVSTNSICQGSQVITFWKHLIERYNIHLDFAHTTFVWNNEAQNQAKVHCVIVGFSGINAVPKTKKLFSSENNYKICKQISPYLTDTPVIFVESRNTPLCDVPKSDLVFLIPDAGLYEFGVLMSNVHNAWIWLVAGRLKSDYRYAKDIVYNTFVWCNPTAEQKSKIESTARGILEARKLYPNSTLANMYDDVLMPPELRKAHQQNNKAVMQAYGFSIKDTTESSCVAELMKLYQKKVSEK